MTKPNLGFTITELVVVIVVVGILITIVSFQATRGQLVARDRERENDVKIITSFFETVYQTGQAGGVRIPPGDGAITTATSMGYPSTDLITSPATSQSQAILGAIEPKALKSPLKSSLSLVGATNATGISSNTAGGITVGATTSTDLYVYQPLDSNNTLCKFATGNATTGTGFSVTNPTVSASPTQAVIAPRLKDNCVKFIIYYFSETSSSIKSVSSTNTNNNGL